MPAAFTYANAHSGISAVAHYASNCVEVTSTSGTSDRQDGPLEMHGKQSGNAQRYAKRRRLRAARTNHSSGYFGSYISSSVTDRLKFLRLVFERSPTATVEVSFRNFISRESIVAH